ncbi:phosphoribosylformylglycinamidine synthase [Marispirochaeta aestuarii]|uniref:Phosphoribosylformylglycinamidine synthase n=1 Tax=Marispirochaeta aestuarii TaxID=1963862 RepID=A0A1Y1RWB9_9SPIO|nr:phosphoribosylformylglycinamidine synthase [Marispirochaeta aestuarii]ORC32955.1 phosphoribosylformylglycinamidine synthase [Marispirochaeta aestuarii]
MVRRVYVEKLSPFAHEAQHTLKEISGSLGIRGIHAARLLHRYDIDGLSEPEFRSAAETILAEAPVDRVHYELPVLSPKDHVLAIEALPGQYDQRADSATQAIQLMTHAAPPAVSAAGVWIFTGDISPENMTAIREYLINPVESREASLDLPESLELKAPEPAQIPLVDGLMDADGETLRNIMNRYGLAMSEADLALCRDYFRNTEKRNPTETELKVLDTYWSDHCRHTTFLTSLEEISFEDNPISRRIEATYREYLELKKLCSPKKPVSLMDLAVIVMKEFRGDGRLEDLEVSEEINACSIRVEARVNGKPEPWLVMFKNETHNHPTEIEPFGGAATCLGGAIRDPLSGRSYVYQAMRVSGAGDPGTALADTLPGKLPQRSICTTAARGYSSYGNQIGIATGKVHEFYHPGYIAKRMEIGAVIGAAPERNVSRLEPAPGDLILLVGGRTGRDGIGGATGSSREHSQDSLASCGAEVQKGNPPTERKLQRLFRDQEFSRRIKRCNDFGAGGVAVAVGELAPGLEINLDAVPKKYAGLDGTELAISESQERMALVIEAGDLDYFIRRAAEENLEATRIAEVTDSGRLVMRWNGSTVVDLSRDFLDTNGAEQQSSACIEGPLTEEPPFDLDKRSRSFSEQLLSVLSGLDSAGQEGLGQLFDSTIGAGSLLMPFGGRTQTSPSDGMAALLPLEEGETDTATLMSFGFDPRISSWSPYHGAVYAVLQSVARITAMGGDYRRTRLTLQEYFERLGKDPKRWGKPLAALLGAFHAQRALGTPAIGGKDSMSGSFEELDVPPTLVSFAVAPVTAERVISQELKVAGSTLLLLSIPRDDDYLPDLKIAAETYGRIHAAEPGIIRSARSIGAGGIAAALAEMAFGNELGVEIDGSVAREDLFRLEYGSIILEVSTDSPWRELFQGLPCREIGRVIAGGELRFGTEVLPLDTALEAWRNPLLKVFPIAPSPAEASGKVEVRGEKKSAVTAARSYTGPKVSPRVLIPVFPGTNCEYDSAAAFRREGALPEFAVVRNLNPRMVDESIARMAAGLKKAQILMIPGGFSAGDEPEGSGKFIAAFFRNPELTDAIHEFLDRDGLVLGICNGFQALIKLGLLPWGRITPLKADSPTLTFNTIDSHVSRFVVTRIDSASSPWLTHTKPGELHWIPVSHGEGRFVAAPEVLKKLEDSGQIAARYADQSGRPTMEGPANPNGSMGAVEALVSPDGRILGKMGHSERWRPGLYRNIPGNKDQGLFKAGVEYFG